MSTDVTVWVVRPTAHVDLTCLTPGERAAAATLGPPAARDRHLRSRAVLRHALAATTATSAAAVPLVAPLGSPPRVHGRHAPQVSLAHADGTIAVAVSASRPVGVDVEVSGNRHRPVPAPVPTGQRLAAVADLVEEELGSLAVWVLLEATLKAVGTGFGTPQEQVRLGRIPGGVQVDVPGHTRHGAVLRVLPGDVVLAVATPHALPAVRVVEPRSVQAWSEA